MYLSLQVDSHENHFRKRSLKEIQAPIEIEVPCKYAYVDVVCTSFYE